MAYALYSPYFAAGHDKSRTTKLIRQFRNIFHTCILSNFDFQIYVILIVCTKLMLYNVLMEFGKII